VKKSLALALTVVVSACASRPAPPARPGEAPPNVTASAAASDTPAPVPIPVEPAIRAIVDAPDRSADDKALDGGRHPGELLTFFGVSPGMKIAELGAGGGYTSELLARAVGPAGTVYGENSPFILKRFAEKPWSDRLSKPVMKNVVRLDRPFDDPFPADDKDLDAVFIVLFYHDTVWQHVDREKMNAAVFRALKPGGVYAIVDHSGRAGSGTKETETFHRIEESALKDEVTKAGFKLDSEANFLRNPSDTRDWNDSPKAAGDRRGTSDRFVLKFVKP
jgi:predicted methyltransferase